MEKQSKDLENIKIEKDSLQATLNETYANYWGLKDTLNVKYNKL